MSIYTDRNHYSLGFSSCPNDTYIFEALVNHRIESLGYHFDISIADVEALNQLAIQGKLDVSKVSFHTYLQVCEEYILLNAGAALGRGCGPLLIAANPFQPDELKDKVVAIPGENTTANLLLDVAFPEIGQKKVMLFSAIEEAVLSGKADIGLIIHESRFTYEQKGLLKIADLGECWEKKTGSPVPLGGIIAKRSLGMDNILKISKLIRLSLEYAYAMPTTGWSYIKSLAQETDDAVIRQHIDLYVNEFTLDLGNEGKEAVEALFDYAIKAGIINKRPVKLFFS